MPIGCRSVMPFRRFPECVVGGQSALLHRGRGQCGEADHVADGVDVLHLGLELFVDPDPSATLDLQAGVLQIEVVGLTLASRGVHHRFGGNLLAAGQGGDRARGADVDGGHLLAEPEGHRQVAQMEFQRFDDLGVAEVQHVGAFFHHGDLGAQRGEHGGVFDADHTGTHDDHRAPAVT